jgi:hypothetical protein
VFLAGIEFSGTGGLPQYLFNVGAGRAGVEHAHAQIDTPKVAGWLLGLGDHVPTKD